MDLQTVSESFGNGDRSWAKHRKGFDTCRSITLDLSLFDELYYAEWGYIPSGTPLSLVSATGRYGPHGSPTDEVQTITVTGSPTGGTYALDSTDGEGPTAAIAPNASAATITSRLEGIFGAGNVIVTGSNGGPYTVTYQGELADVNVAPLTLATNSLTGGSSPSVTLATTTAGGADADAGQELAGHLFNDCPVKQGNEDGRAAGALFWEGIVDETRLPFPIPASSKSQVPHIRYEEG